VSSAVLVAFLFLGSDPPEGDGVAALVRQGKVAVGEAVFAPDPRDRRAAFARAERAFESVLEHGLRAEAAALEEARAYLRELHTELEPNRLEDRAIPVRVLVVACGLDGEITRMNWEKYRTLAYKARDRSDPEEARRIREKSLETVRVRTSVSPEERARLEAHLERAARAFFEWSRGRARLEIELRTVSGRIRDLRQRGGRALWVLGTAAERRGARGPEEILDEIRRMHPEQYDFVLVVPDYERGDDALPAPSDDAERAATFEPLDGVIGIAHLALMARGDGRKEDGFDERPDYWLRVIDRVYELLRAAIVRDAGGAGVGEPLRPRRVQGLDAWLPAPDRELVVGYKRYPPGQAFYGEVFAHWFGPGMFRGATRATSDLRSSRAMRIRSGDPPLVDRDLRTGGRLAPASPLRLEFGRPSEVGAIGLVFGSAHTELVEVAVTVDTAEEAHAVKRVGSLQPGRAWRFALPSKLKIHGLSIELRRVEATPTPVELREILFW